MNQDPPPLLVTIPEAAPAPDRFPARVIARLPSPLSSFVGRTRELADVRDLLLRDDVRLLTLTGPGGVGKTRLAIHTAETIAAAFAHGVAFVALEGVREPELVLPAIHQALGGREEGSDLSIEQFHAVLADRELLLVLDNVEHLASAAMDIAGLLAVFPRLKVLATSRAALRLSAEHDYLTPPLALPDGQLQSSDDEASWSEALQLFVQRARAARVGLQLTGDDFAVAGEICRRLDGLPLAIELAAARIDHLSLQAILGRLDAPATGLLPMLTDGLRDQPARQHTMRDVIAWSYHLLDEREQQLFRQISIFVDGFTASAASVVCDLDELQGLDGIASLVARSLVRYAGDHGHDPRYRVFETIREFGLEQLVASGQDAVVRQRHAEWGLAAARSLPRGSASQFDLLDQEHANLRAALTWFQRQREGPSLLQLAAALAPFWEERAHYVEGRHWLEAAIALSEAIRTSDRLAVLSSAGTMAWLGNDFPHAVFRHGQALLLARVLGDRKAEAFARNNLGAQAMELGDSDEACRQFEACMEVAREANEPEMRMCALHNLGQLRRMQFDSSRAMTHMQEAHALARELAADWIMPNVLNGIGMGMLDLGDPAQSDEMLREALHAGLGQARLSEVMDSLEGLARVRAVGEDEGAANAARLFAAAEVQRERLSTPMSALENTYFGWSVRRSRASLGAEAFAAAWAEGRALTVDDAITLALASPPPPSVRPVAGHVLPSGTLLTARELAVLRHIAGGLNNREMAERLQIRPATVARHIANLYRKLGIHSRAEAVVSAHRLRLL